MPAGHSSNLANPGMPGGPWKDAPETSGIGRFHGRARHFFLQRYFEPCSTSLLLIMVPTQWDEHKGPYVPINLYVSLNKTPKEAPVFTAKKRVPQIVPNPLGPCQGQSINSKTFISIRPGDFGGWSSFGVAKMCGDVGWWNAMYLKNATSV